jgi:hypothetical protein
MPMHQAIWQVGEKLEPLQATQLAAEELLREMIIQDPRILSNDRMIIGTQGAHLCQLQAGLAGPVRAYSSVLCAR